MAVAAKVGDVDEAVATATKGHLRLRLPMQRHFWRPLKSWVVAVVTDVSDLGEALATVAKVAATSAEAVVGDVVAAAAKSAMGTRPWPRRPKGT